MHKQVKNSTNQHGFTLIEIVLVMAILLILLSVVYATFLIVNNSHAQVAVINDAKDYAYLNMAYIENDITNANGIIIATAANKFPLAGEAGYTSLYYDNGVLMRATSSASTAAVFSYPQYSVTTASGPKPKWGVTATYSKNTDGTLKVNLKVVDNATGSVYYTLDKNIILLNVSDAAKIVGSAGPVVKYINYVQP